MTSKVLVFLALFQFSLSLHAKTRIYFSPKGKCEEKIVELIDRSQKSLRIVIYSMTNQPIIMALYKAKARGVDVQILADRLQAAGRSSKVLDLHKAGFKIKVHSKYKIEHNKFVIADDRVMETGSFNFTNSAQHVNSENCMFFTQKSVIGPFLKRFHELWKLNTREASEEYIQRLIERRKEREEALSI